MKRLCAVLVNEWPKKNSRYIEAMLDAWEEKGVDTCLIIPEDTNGQVGRRVVDNIQQVLSMAADGSFDELIMMTDALMGPVCSLEGFLCLADKCVQKAWRLTKDAPMWGIKSELWADLMPANTFYDIQVILASQNDCVCELYETDDLKEITKLPLLDKPLTLIRDRKCPFFLHEVFHRNYGDVVTTTLGHQGKLFYQWLYRESGWDTDLLWDYLLSSCHQQDYYQNMHLNYVLSTVGSDSDWVEEHLKTHTLALVMHLYYPDKFKESCSFAERFPFQTNVIITTSDEEKREQILKIFPKNRFASINVRVIENRGRDVSALLVGAAEVFNKYDYVCFFHDKKTLQTNPGSIGAGFAYRLQENLFPTKDFVNNVIRLFNENKRLGLLSPAPPHHGDYFFTLGLNWGPNYNTTKQLCERFAFSAPISLERMPIAPLGTCFWFRGYSLKPLADQHWKYEDFPPEPNGVDGTLLHAIERLYPYACVEAGFYPAFLMSDRYAKIEHSSVRYYVREFNRLCVNHGILDYHRNMCKKLDAML